MNLKISEKGFRFRIAPEDLGVLLSGRDIEQRVCIGEHCFFYRIVPVSSEDEMALEMSMAGFCLSVSQKNLEQLHDLGRSKAGLSVTQGGVDVSLQIDLKKQMKKVA